jgi:hypothetical protein
MTQKRPTQKSLKGCSQASREARPPSPTPPGSSLHGLFMVPGDELLWACGQDGQYEVAAPLVTFFLFKTLSADSPEVKNSPTYFNYVLNSAPFDVSCSETLLR